MTFNVSLVKKKSFDALYLIYISNAKPAINILQYNYS